MALPRLPRKLKRFLTAASSSAPADVDVDASASASTLSAQDGSKMLRMTAPVEFVAAAADADNKLPTFSIRAYDGGPMHVSSFSFPVIVDLSGVKTRKSIKALRDHDRSRIVGHITNTKISASGIDVQGVVSGTGPDAQEVVANHKNQFPWEASIGADVLRREFLEAGKTAVVNGITVTGPIWLIRESLLSEVSFVAIGAAENTSVDMAAARGKDNITMNFDQWLQAKGFDPATLTAQQKTYLEAAYKREVEVIAPTADANAAAAADVNANSNINNMINASTQPQTINAAAAASGGDVIGTFRAEMARANQINAKCAASGNPTIEVNGQKVSLAAHAIEHGWDLDRVELEILRASRPSDGTLFINTGAGRSDINARVIEAALCLSARLNREFVERHFDERTLEAADSPRMRGITLQGLIHTTITAHGGYVPFGRIDNDAIKAAFALDPLVSPQGPFGLQASGGFTTISLSGILGNLANKAMLERFNALESVVSQIAYETDNNNFQPHYLYRLDSDGKFTKVGKDGELKHIALKETEYASRLDTYGGMIALTRQMIYDDNLGAFLQIPQIFGELAIYAREQAVFELILSNPNNFFDASKGNYFEGAGTNLSLSSLATAVKMFREMKNANGQPIMISPDRLLLPPALEEIANAIFASDYVNETTPQGKRSPDRNTYKGRFRPIVSPFLATSQGLSGSSDNAWYLLAPPSAGRAIVQVGYLRGQRTPTIEAASVDFNQLGMQFRGFYDFGAAMFEPKAGIKCKGSA